MEATRVSEHYDLELTDEDGRAIGMRAITWQDGRDFMLRLQATRDGDIHGSSKPPYSCKSAEERKELLDKLIAQSRSRFARRLRAKAAAAAAAAVAAKNAKAAATKGVRAKAAAPATKRR